MIVGIGVDVVQIDRFLPWVENMALAGRFFSEQELAGVSERQDVAQALAVRFAAKEAFGKALGTGLRNLVLKDIQVLQDDFGKPFFDLVGTARKLFLAAGASAAHLSLSHDGNYGIAHVVLESGNSEEKYIEKQQKKGG